MREWVIEYCRQYPTFQLLFFVIATDTYQKSYIPGKLRTQIFYILKIAIFLIDLTDISQRKIWSTGDLSATNASTLE